MGPIWGRQDPGGPHVGPMNLAIWVDVTSEQGFQCDYVLPSFSLYLYLSTVSVLSLTHPPSLYTHVYIFICMCKYIYISICVLLYCLLFGIHFMFDISVWLQNIYLNTLVDITITGITYVPVPHGVGSSASTGSLQRHDVCRIVRDINGLEYILDNQ